MNILFLSQNHRIKVGGSPSLVAPSARGMETPTSQTVVVESKNQPKASAVSSTSNGLPDQTTAAAAAATAPAATAPAPTATAVMPEAPAATAVTAPAAEASTAATTSTVTEPRRVERPLEERARRYVPFYYNRYLL